MKFWCRFCCAIVVLEFASLVFLLVFAGRFLDGPASSPGSADVIVVLGGATMSDRLKKGGELYRQGYAKHILVTGFSNPSDQVLPLLADWRLKYLEKLGVPKSAILCDTHARSTWMEAEAIKNLLEKRQWHRALVVSDPPHLRRINWALEKNLATSAEYRLISSEPPWWNRNAWWGNSTSVSFVITELIKILYYVTKYAHN